MASAPDDLDELGGSGAGMDDLDFDDGDMGATSVGTELFKEQAVPAYPAIARIGRYEILGRLARGGMAEVYLARSREDDGTVRHVVVKRVLTEVENDPEMRELFLEEGRTAVRLYHPNVCHVYEYGDANGMTFMALEWVFGVSLRDAIRRAAPRGLPIPVVVHIAAKVAGALEYVHTAKGTDGRVLGIVHQDVTPHNVMMRWTGEVKLLDFGIAKQAGKGVERGKAIQGKYEYMSPEQVRGKPLDARSDVFALGVCVYEALTSKQLYGRGGPPQSMVAITNEPVPSLEKDRAGIPRDLDVIVQRALQKDPKDRWPSAGAFQKALEGWLAQNRHSVGEQRVAVSLGTLFTPAEKQPLPSDAKRMTGTLQAMDLGEANAVLEGVSSTRVKTPEAEPAWSTSFSHEPSEPPAALEGAAPIEIAPLPPPPSFDPPPPMIAPLASGAPSAAVAPAPSAPAPASRAWIWGVIAFVAVVGLGVGLWLSGLLGLPHP